MISSTNSKNLSVVGETLKGFGRPLCYTRVQISVEPDRKTQYKMNFAPLEPINDPSLIAEIDAKIDQGHESLHASPIVEEEANKHPGARGGRPAAAKGRIKVKTKTKA